jgi:hypothetical protein
MLTKYTYDYHTYNRLTSDAHPNNADLSRLAEDAIGANRFNVPEDLCKKDLQDALIDKLIKSENGCFCHSFSLKEDEGEWVNIVRADGSLCVEEIDTLLHTISANPPAKKPAKQTPSRKGRKNKNAADEDDDDDDEQEVIYIANLI